LLGLLSISYEEFNSYDAKGKNIYSTYGYLNFNKLDEIYYGTKIDDFKFNHIHISMSFNNNYYLLSSVTIASILENSSNSSFIHIHIISVDNFMYSTMKKLNSLKYKINNNSEFIFYNGKEAEEDFGLQTKNEFRGLGEYARLLSLKIINNTDRVIVIDSADLIIKADLFELYNYPLDNLFFRGTVDPFAPCWNYSLYNKKDFINGGVILFNLKRCKENNLYHQAVKFYNNFKYKVEFNTPYQDILNHFISAKSMGLLPLRYNMQGYAEIKDNYNYSNYNLLNHLNCSTFYKKENEIKKEEKKLVIRHYNKFKVYDGNGEKLEKEWNYYAKKTGFYKEICGKYPKGCYNNKII
jgi:lipopolysaccharide biosynthesis glycosyltransferase